jgi:hypothetical protein
MIWLLIFILIAAYLIAMRKEILIWLKLMKEKIK